MGVPAFYRWLSEKYPKIIQDVLEERVPLATGSTPLLPLDWTGPNPSGLECDNLYIDMNGIIHPCSHPEQGPQPTTEEEMYENVCHYVDRLMRICRPRRLIYLGIDGVAPRAKMNQQRARRFRSAQEARELVHLEQHIRDELVEQGQAVPAVKKKPWDSNVITPGTPFMINLAEYIRFYIRRRISTDKAWKGLKVIFSDASLPGEGEHKIMSHIRLQRAQTGYNPNLVHVLHGLDADLIMLALATHEAHFYITREQVLFGRKSIEQQEQRQMETGFTDAQKALDEKVGPDAMDLLINQQKPLHRVSIPILREYLQAEFAGLLHPGRLPFTQSLERLIDDFVFMCFFVGNDFLPHLPSLDIRDGGLDYLLNVYKRLLPGLGGYITESGGKVNLSHVDVILAEVGAIEDYVFQMKHESEQRNAERRKQMRNRPKGPPALTAPPEVHKVRGRSAKILEQKKADAVALKKKGKTMIKPMMLQDNDKAAENLRASLAPKTVEKEIEKPEPSSGSKRPRGEEEEDDSEKEGDKKKEKKEKVPGVVGDAEDEFDADDDDDDDDKPDVDAVIETTIVSTDPMVANSFKEKVKTEQQKKLDDYSKNVKDNVRLHEAGWKDRYYSDKCKADDISENGGRENLFRSYVMGLCWVMKYYYDGCPSWKWYYPYHYGPFASDLKNIERFEKDCKSFELSTPFNPVEQLMAVLPSDSKHAIPTSSRWLMTDRESPIIDFYPTEVPVDPNGKAMPWLWVVLLPFIDEDRLLGAMSPTMTKWTKHELFCNARGLDDGYIYIHREHPLSKKFAMVLKDGKTSRSAKTRLTDAAAYGCAGFSGSVRPPLSNELIPIDEDVKIPPPASASNIDRRSDDNIFADAIEVNEAVCVAFSEPSKFSHKSVLLPGARPLPPSLTDDDKRIRRPRLNRFGGTIANLGTGGKGQSYQSGYGSMNIGSYERQLAERTGRGGQMHQAGTRAWGAMEPTPKRSRGPPPPQHQMGNPFMRGPPQQHPGGHQPNHRPPWQQQQAPPNSHFRFDQAGRQEQGYRQQQHQQPRYGGQQQYQQQQHRQQGYNAGGQNNMYRGDPRNQNQRYQQQPPQQQQGYNFRNHNQGPGNQQGRGGRQQPRASTDVMSNLRAQLTNTLKQNRNSGAGNNRR